MSKRSEKLFKSFGKISKEIVSIILEESTYQNPANWSFYSEKLSRIRPLILLMKAKWMRFADLEVEEVYFDTVKKDRKVLKKTGRVYDDTYQAVAANIIKDLANLDFVGALDQGENDIQRLFRLTQQNHVSELKINAAIKRGLKDGTHVSIKSQLLKQIEKKIGKDGKIITVNTITGKTRRYKPETYARLVTRTRLTEAQSEATIQTSLGYASDLVRVSDHNTTTPVCIPYEGRIFSITGDSKEFPKLIRRPPFHPNCLHRLSPVIINVDSKRGKRIIEQQKQQEKSNEKKIDIYFTKDANTPAQKRQRALIEAQNNSIMKGTNL